MFSNDRSFTPASFANSVNLKGAWMSSERHQHRGQNSQGISITTPGTNPHAGSSGQPARPPALMGRDATTSQPYRPAPNSSAHRRSVKQRQRGTRDTQIQKTRPADRSTQASHTDTVTGPTSYAIDSHIRSAKSTPSLSSPAVHDHTNRALGHRERSRAIARTMRNSNNTSVGHDARPSTTPSSTAGGAAHVSAAATSGADNGECHLCGRILGQKQHACMDCSAVICASCVINAATFHPGHTLQPAAPRGRHEQAPLGSQAQARRTKQQHNCFICQQEPRDERYKCQTCPDDLSLCKSCLDMHPADHVFEIIPCAPSDGNGPRAEGPRQIFKCFICREQLSGVRYECMTCSDNVNFCEAHHEMHPTDHQMATIQCVAPPSAQLDDFRRDVGAALPADVTGGAGGPRGESRHRATGGRGNSDGDGDGDSGSGSGSGSDPHSARPQRSSARLGKQPDVITRPPHHGVRFGRQGRHDNGDDPPSSKNLINHGRRRLPSEVTVTFSRERLLQFAHSAYAKANMAMALAQAVDGAGSSRQETLDSSPNRDQHSDINPGEEHEGAGDGHSDDDYDLYKLLDFDIDVALVEVPEQRRQQRKGRDDGTMSRRWSPEEKRQLRTLMREGKSDAHIATVLGRTPGAVAQQWRKQC